MSFIGDNFSSIAVEADLSLAFNEYDYYLDEALPMTPPSNTGSKPKTTFAVHVDWLQGILHFTSFFDLQAILGVITGMTGDEIPWADAYPFTCGRKWPNSIVSVYGVRVCWDNLEPGVFSAKALISLPGSYWSRLGRGLLDAWDVCTFLKEQGFRATRFDANVDDYQKHLKKELIDEASRKGNFAYFKKKPIYREDLETGGWSFTFGHTPKRSKSAPDKQVVIYDKSVESDYEIDAIRIETRYRDERAQELFERFCSVPVEFNRESELDVYESVLSSLLASVVCGSISFVDKESGAWAARCELLDWWQKFVDFLQFGDAMKIPSNRPKPTMDTKIRWLIRSVATSYQTVKEVLDDTFWKFEKEFSDAGKKKQTESHKAFIRVSKNEFPEYRMGVYWCSNLGDEYYAT